MRPISSRFFGPDGIQCVFAIDNMGNTDVGYIIKQTGDASYTITNGTVIKNCRLATNLNDVNDLSQLPPGQCTFLIQFTDNSIQHVDYLLSTKCSTIEGFVKNWNITGPINNIGQIIIPQIGDYMQVTYPLSSYQLLNLDTMPVEVVPAPGVGKYLAPMFMIIDFAPGTTYFSSASAGNVTLSWTGEEQAAILEDGLDQYDNAPFIGPNVQHFMLMGINIGAGYGTEIENVGLSVAYTGSLGDSGTVASISLNDTSTINGNGTDGNSLPAAVGDTFTINGDGDGTATGVVSGIAQDPIAYTATGGTLTFSGNQSDLFGNNDWFRVVPPGSGGDGYFQCANGAIAGGQISSIQVNASQQGVTAYYAPGDVVTLSGAGNEEATAIVTTVAGDFPIVSVVLDNPSEPTTSAGVVTVTGNASINSEIWGNSGFSRFSPTPPGGGNGYFVNDNNSATYDSESNTTAIHFTTTGSSGPLPTTGSYSLITFGTYVTGLAVDAPGMYYSVATGIATTTTPPAFWSGTGGNVLQVDVLAVTNVATAVVVTAQSPSSGSLPASGNVIPAHASVQSDTWNQITSVALGDDLGNQYTVQSNLATTIQTSVEGGWTAGGLQVNVDSITPVIPTGTGTAQITVGYVVRTL